MFSKGVKRTAIPAGLSLASFRVYAGTETKRESLSPRELPIYSPESSQLRYEAERPGFLQRGLGAVRVGLEPYLWAVKGACISAKLGAINLYHAGQDTYLYLRDPPPGFLPRTSVIAIAGFAGLVLARKGSRVKRLGVSLGLASVGTAICYPAQTVRALKVTGKKVNSAAAVASLWKPSPVKSTVAPPPSPEPNTANPSPAPAADEEPLLSEGLEARPTPDLVEGTVLAPAPNPAPQPDPEPEPEPEPDAVSVEDSDSPEPLPEASSQTPVVPEKNRFNPDSRLMDHGQSNPEDADLYSTRS